MAAPALVRLDARAPSPRAGMLVSAGVLFTFYLASLLDVRPRAELASAAWIFPVPTVNSIRPAPGPELGDVRRHGGCPQTDLMDSDWAVPVTSLSGGGNPDAPPAAQRTATKISKAGGVF